MHRYDCQHDQYRQGGKENIPGVVPINIEYGFHTHLLYVFFREKKEEQKGEVKEKVKVMSRDKITDFSL